MRKRRFQKKKVTEAVPPTSDGEKLRIYCLFCYKFSTVEDTEDSQGQTEKLNICYRFYKHIGGDELPFTEEMYGAKCGVCDNCFYMIDNHCRLHYEIACLRLKLKWQMYKLCRVMKYAGKATSRVKEFEKGLMEEVAVAKDSKLERVLSFRKRLLNKCSQELKKKNPRVILEKHKGKNNSALKDSNEYSSKSKVSKATQTVGELTESTQLIQNNVCNKDDKEVKKCSQVETKQIEQINSIKIQESNNHDDNFKGFECGNGAERKMLPTNPNYKCIICDKEFGSNEKLVEHERDQHRHLITGDKLQESLSSDIVTTTINTNLNERKCNGNKLVSHCCTPGITANPTFACAVCGILYSSLNSLNAHLITAHNMVITPVTNQIDNAIVEEGSSKSILKSQDNGFQKVPDEVPGCGDEDAVTVRKTPRRPKRFQAECPKCGKIFKCVDKWLAKQKVKRHLRTKMHGGTGIWKECDNCGRRFKTKYLLKMHRRSPCETSGSDGGSTSGPGNLLVLREIFKCCHCFKTFSTQEKLASHEGARECFSDNDEESEASGGITYNHDWSLKKSVKLVKPVFTASCPICWKVFERCNEKDLQAVLNRHLYESKLHGGQNSWKHVCASCGVRYQNKSRLERHLKRNHNEESAKLNAGNDGIDFLINTGSLEHLSWNQSNPLNQSKLGDQDFKCSFCDFHTNAYDLMDHENTYHSYYVSDEKLKCSRCPQIFDLGMAQNYSNLRAHFLRVHLDIETNIQGYMA